MIKTTSLTKTVYNSHPTHSQPINLFTPSTSSSGSVCETDPSSICSSYKSNSGANDDTTFTQHEESNSSSATIERLKRELGAVKQARNQLASLYKVNFPPSTLSICQRYSLVKNILSCFSSYQLFMCHLN